jgi:hypothetical protein
MLERFMRRVSALNSAGTTNILNFILRSGS